MAKRMQLNDEQVEQVTGGAFNFYTSKEGQRLVYVDGVGTFNCNDSASAWIISQITSPNASEEAIVKEALEKGMLWK